MVVTKLYTIGSNRLAKIRPALENEFEIVPNAASPVPKVFNSIPGLPLTGKLAQRLAPIVRHRNDEDFAVLTNSVGKLSFVAGALCQRLNVPFLVRIRGGMGGEFADRARTNGYSQHRAALYGIGKDLLRNAVLDQANGVLPISRFTRTQVLTESGNHVTPGQTRVVGNPIKVDRFDGIPGGEFKSALNIPDDASLVLTITGFSYQQKFAGVSHFMPAIARVLKANPDWHFAVAGDGAGFEDGRDEILAAAPSKVRDRVHLPGFWSPIETALTDADIALHLSFRDAAPMTVLEAQAARTPVIVNDAGGMPELIDETGLSKDVPAVVTRPDEIRRPLETLIKNPSLRDRIGKHNRTHIGQNFNTGIIGREFRTAIDTILGESEVRDARSRLSTRRSVPSSSASE